MLAIWFAPGQSVREQHERPTGRPTSCEHAQPFFHDLTVGWLRKREGDGESKTRGRTMTNTAEIGCTLQDTFNVPRIGGLAKMQNTRASLPKKLHHEQIRNGKNRQKKKSTVAAQIGRRHGEEWAAADELSVRGGPQLCWWLGSQGTNERWRRRLEVIEEEEEEGRAKCHYQKTNWS